MIGLAVSAKEISRQSKASDYRFIRVSGSNSSTNPLDYEYHPAEICLDTDPSKHCSAEWSEPTAPSVGDNPTGTMVAGSLQKGDRL
ncbi:hypothetical protein [Sphingobacterium sp.]|uniref:hypothetical protein n=1 Tax=Sphingobacterium sp. TaxID=341027 RepID=UPI0028A929E3|nr:hypothetical protein [Sphingobacterium sp.]